MWLNLIKFYQKKYDYDFFFTVITFSVFSTIEAKIRDVNIFLSCVKFSVFYPHTTIKDIEITYNTSRYTSRSHDFLVGTHQNVILRESL